MNKLSLLVTPARLIMAVFTMHAVVMTNWFPRIPDVQAKLGVGPGDLSTALLGTPIGTVIALTFAGPVIERLTARRTVLFAFILYAAAFTLPGWAWNVPTLFGALFLVGLFLPVVDVAMNVEADRIERAGGRRIMNTCHGFWSVGSIIGGVVGAAFAAAVIEPRWHMLIVSLVSLPIALAAAAALPPATRARIPDSERPPRFALPTVGLLGVCVFAFGMMLVESAVLDWSGVYLRSVIGASPGATGLGFGAFAVFMAIGRFLGDGRAERYGPVLIARTCSVVALAGTVALVSAPNLAVAVAGLAAMGLGVSVAVPLAVSAAAGRGDRPAAVNVAALSLVSFGGFLVEPPLVGQVGELGGLRLGMAMIMPAIVASALLSGHVYRKTASNRRESEPDRVSDPAMVDP